MWRASSHKARPPDSPLRELEAPAQSVSVFHHPPPVREPAGAGQGRAPGRGTRLQEVELHIFAGKHSLGGQLEEGRVVACTQHQHLLGGGSVGAGGAARLLLLLLLLLLGCLMLLLLLLLQCLLLLCMLLLQCLLLLCMLLRHVGGSSTAAFLRSGGGDGGWLQRQELQQQAAQGCISRVVACSNGRGYPAAAVAPSQGARQAACHTMRVESHTRRGRVAAAAPKPTAVDEWRALGGAPHKVVHIGVLEVAVAHAGAAAMNASASRTAGGRRLARQAAATAQAGG